MIKLRTTVINVVLFVVFIFMSLVIMKSDINNLGCILFVHLSSICLENFKDLALIIPEILELIKLHTYKFGLVYTGVLMSYFKHLSRVMRKSDFLICELKGAGHCAADQCLCFRYLKTCSTIPIHP